MKTAPGDLTPEYSIDAIILATARSTASVLWTQDEHFKDIPGVKYFAAAPKAG
jgi:predicted nucleic acid-binding protein